MAPSSDSDDPNPADTDAGGLGPSFASKVQKQDLEERLQIVKRKEKRHLLWTVLGFSPGAVIPALGLMREGNPGMLLVLAGLVGAYQWYAWTMAAREADALEKKLYLLSEDGEAQPAQDPADSGTPSPAE
jgi:hypothetical protein